MKINSVQNIQSIPVIFRGAKIPSAQPSMPVSCDVFVKSAVSEIDMLKENLYTSVISKVKTADSSDIEKIIKNIISHTGVEKNIVLQTLAKLTTYSGYKSLALIQKQLANEGIGVIGRIPKIEDNDTAPLCLSDVIRYILMKNGRIPNAKNDAQQGIILDTELVNYAERLLPAEQEKFLKTLSKSKIVYFEDFENGCNFLNRGKGIEQTATDMIERMKDGTLLDSDTKERAEALGLKITVIKNSVPKNISPQTIVNNINPIVPTKEDFIKTLSSVMNKQFEGAENTKYQKYVLNFAEKMIFPVSALEYAKSLKEINKKIEKFLQKNEKNPDNVYYILPTTDKSFVTALYQYKKANNIEKLKCIMPEYDSWYEKFYNFKDIPEDSTLIILDDCILTGLTMIQDAFNYTKNARKLKNKSIIFASVVGTNQGITNIKNLIKTHGREKKDLIITGKIAPEWESHSALSDMKYLDMQASIPYITAITLPYIGPDTNCELLHPLLKKFLFFPKAQKLSNKNLDFNMNL